jgi:phosphoribosylanthranilate isomerase
VIPVIRVKICGITSAADARAACKAGANSLGLNFYEQSPRHISVADAAKIRAELPKSVAAVGVFVNLPPDAVAATCSTLHLDAAQLHGDELPSSVAELSRKVAVIKAFRVNTDFALDTLARYAQAFAFLLDASHAGQYGGTGHTTDWALARRAAASHRIILAGGLKPENVAAAIRIVHPYAVDVASGVESKPGKKDHARLREFIQEVRRAEKQLDSHAVQSKVP